MGSLHGLVWCGVTGDMPTRPSGRVSVGSGSIGKDDGIKALGMVPTRTCGIGSWCGEDGPDVVAEELHLPAHGLVRDLVLDRLDQEPAPGKDGMLDNAPLRRAHGRMAIDELMDALVFGLPLGIIRLLVG